MGFKFRKLWAWEKNEEEFYKQFCEGRVLHVCCGQSKFGDVRVDIEPQDPGVLKADYRHLPFKNKSFDTVICDPPWAKRERLDAGLSWLFELARIARKRIVLVHNTVFSIKGFKLSYGYAVNSRGLLWKVMMVYDRIEEGTNP